MKKYFSLLAISFAMCSSCSFNKSFYHPDKIPAGVKGATIVDHTGHDTLNIRFSGSSHQPVFIKHVTDTVDLGFTVESIIFKSTSGNNLNGWLLKPHNRSSAITILHLHGNGGSLVSQYQAISPLVKKGFQVFTFDYSGYGFSEGQPTRQNILKDALSAVDYLKSREDAVNTKMVIYGQSLGGHLAAEVASEKQDVIDGLVMEGAFSSHKDIAVHMTGLGFIARLLVREQYSALKAIEKYKKPLLVIHSTEDKVIPFSMGKKIVEHANAPKSFYEIQKCHICGPEFYADSIASRIRTMLNP